MADTDFDEQNPGRSHYSVRSILIRDWPYITMLLLAVFGVAYTNFARAAMTGYWIALAPIYGLICVGIRWRNLEDSQAHVRLIISQALHWSAVILAMYLVFVSDVKQMMSEIASSLMVLTVLALGTFTAGIHVVSWRVCAVGAVLGVGVPVVAWFEESTLLILLLVLVLLGVIVVLFMLDHRRSAKESF